MYERGEDWYGWLNGVLPIPTDYFDFPSTMVAFGESLSSSHLASVDDKAFFRMRNDQLTLMTYYCDAPELHAILVALQEDGFKIKSLNFANKDMSPPLSIKSYGLEHYIVPGWSIDGVIGSLTHHDSYKFRKAVQRGERDYDICYDMSIGEVMDVFDAWVENAKTRHFMVVQGHYKRYIQRYFQFGDNVKLIGFRRKIDGVLYGVVGYELFGGQAQMTLGKHRVGDYYFSRYLWLTVIDNMLKDGATKCYCGTTANELKDKLGMQSVKSYKVEIP